VDCLKKAAVAPNGLKWNEPKQIMSIFGFVKWLNTYVVHTLNTFVIIRLMYKYAFADMNSNSAIYRVLRRNNN